jgi:hypothetical protein
MHEETESDWVWVTKENNPVIHQFSANSGVSELLSNKYETDPPSELSVFLDYMDPFTETTCRCRKKKNKR